MRGGPLSTKQKRVRTRYAAVVGLGSGISMGLVSIYGTYTYVRIPTFTEAVGMMLLFAGWNVVAFTLVVLPDIDNFTIDNPFSDFPITLLYLGLMVLLLAIDMTLFASEGFNRTTTITANNQALVSLLFSGLLVLLYYDQHRTQRQQAELMKKQTTLEERRTSWREAQERPRLSAEYWEFFENEEAILDDALEEVPESSLVSFLTRGFTGSKTSLFTAHLSNRGGTTARSLYLNIEVLVESADLSDRYLHLNGSFLFVKSDLFRLDSDLVNQFLNQKSTHIKQEDQVHLLGATAVIITGQSESTTDTLGEYIRSLPFSVESVVLRASIKYEGPTETEHSEPIAAVRLPADELDSLASAFSFEYLVEFERVPTVGAQESQRFFQKEFADITWVNGDVAKITYDIGTSR